MTAPTLTFLAPPSFDGGNGYDDAAEPGTRSAPGRRPATERRAGALRMTRGARAAATGMKVSTADVQRCLDTPDDVSADPGNVSRTRFRRGDLTVVSAADGMVLRVARRGR